MLSKYCVVKSPGINDSPSFIFASGKQLSGRIAWSAEQIHYLEEYLLLRNCDRPIVRHVDLIQEDIINQQSRHRTVGEVTTKMKTWTEV